MGLHRPAYVASRKRMAQSRHRRHSVQDIAHRTRAHDQNAQRRGERIVFRAYWERGVQVFIFSRRITEAEFRRSFDFGGPRDRSQCPLWIEQRNAQVGDLDGPNLLQNCAGVHCNLDRIFCRGQEAFCARALCL